MSRANLSLLINAKTASQITSLNAQGKSPAEISELVETTDGVNVSVKAVTKFLGETAKPKPKPKAKAKPKAEDKPDEGADNSAE